MLTCGCSSRNSKLRVRRTSRHGESLALLQHIALTLPKQDRTGKLGPTNKRLAVDWNHDYLTPRHREREN
jgi:hypothetical protein